MARSYQEMMSDMSRFHEKDAPLEDSRSAGVDASLSELPKGFATAVKGLLNSRVQKNDRQEGLYERQIIMMCKLHDKTIKSIEESLGFLLEL